MRGVGVMVVVPIVVATALRLLIAWVNVSATRTNPAVEDRTTFFLVVVLSQGFAMVVMPVMSPAVVVVTVARLAAMVVGQWGMRTQIESDIATTARSAAIDIGLAAAAAGSTGVGAGVALSAMIAATTQNHGRRGQYSMAMVRGGLATSMPITESGTSCVSPTAANPAEAVALVDAAQGSSDVTQFLVHGIAWAVVAVFTVIVAVIIIVVVIIMVMRLARRTVFGVSVFVVVVAVMRPALVWTSVVFGGMLVVGVFNFLNIFLWGWLFICQQ